MWIQRAKVSAETFGQFYEKTGKGYIIGTDGHRMAAVQSEHWPEYKNEKAPPAEQVTPFDAQWLGSIKCDELDGARYFPAKWSSRIVIKPETIRVAADFVTGKGRLQKKVKILENVRVDWFKLERLTFTFGLALPYLLDAIDFIGTTQVHVWGEDAIGAFAFTATEKPLVEASRIAVVMSMRV